ncbi:MAG: hypothetical protein ABR597_08635 [Bacteroidales bacterium]
MQRTNIYLFLILAGLLFLVAVVIFWYSHSASTLRASDSDFSLEPSLEVLKIEIISGHDSKEVVMEKDEQGRWILNNRYYANDLAVQQLIDLCNRLQVRQPVSMENRAQVDDMLSNRGVVVNIYVQAYRIHLGEIRLIPYRRAYQSFVVGENTPDGLSTYMRKAGSQIPFRVHVPALETGISFLFDPDEREWRNPVIIDMPRNQINRVTMQDFENPDDSYRLIRESADAFAFYHLNENQKITGLDVDSQRVERFLLSFEDIHYESLLNEQQEQERKKLMFEQPFMKVAVENREGMEVSFTAFARNMPEGDNVLPGEGPGDPHRFYIQVNDDEFALAQYYVFSRILRPLSFFDN